MIAKEGNMHRAVDANQSACVPHCPSRIFKTVFVAIGHSNERSTVSNVIN
jgi:hypothetical protein